MVAGGAGPGGMHVSPPIGMDVCVRPPFNTNVRIIYMNINGSVECYQCHVLLFVSATYLALRRIYHCHVFIIATYLYDACDVIAFTPRIQYRRARCRGGSRGPIRRDADRPVGALNHTAEAVVRSARQEAPYTPRI